MKRILVVGGGQAGHSVAAKLRSCGFDGRIVLICGEDELPYQRPPLSKKYLLGEFERERLNLRPRDYYSDNGIELMLGERCNGIDPNGRKIELDSGMLNYDELVLATGSTPRNLPEQAGGLLDGVHTVRTVADIDGMRAELTAGMNVLVVGGGYIGLETAATCATKGCNVTIVEVADRILQRVAAPETSNYFRALHSDRGVRVLEGTALARLLAGTGGRVAAAELKGAGRIDADLAVVGIGILPSTELAEAAGLEIDNGIRVDAYGRTSADGVWAAGDCASFPLGGKRIRLESVQNAIDQAEIVAENILGAKREYVPVPWFWSDQFDTKLQIAGLGTGYDRIISRRIEGAAAASFWYFAGDSLLAVDAINDSRSYMVGKRLLETGKAANTEVLADPSANLKLLIR